MKVNGLTVRPRAAVKNELSAKKRCSGRCSGDCMLDKNAQVKSFLKAERCISAKIFCFSSLSKMVLVVYLVYSSLTSYTVIY